MPKKKSAAKKRAGRKKKTKRKYKVVKVKLRSRRAPPPSIADKITAALDTFVRVVRDAVLK